MRLEHVGLASLVMSVCSCSPVSSYDLEHPPTVIMRTYEPARTYTTFEPTYTLMMIGDVLLPILSGSEQVEVYDDEDFVLRLNGKNGLFDVYVGREVYQKTKEGGLFDLKENPYSLSD